MRQHSILTFSAFICCRMLQFSANAVQSSASCTWKSVTESVPSHPDPPLQACEVSSGELGFSHQTLSALSRKKSLPIATSQPRASSGWSGCQTSVALPSEPRSMEERRKSDVIMWTGYAKHQKRSSSFTAATGTAAKNVRSICFDKQSTRFSNCFLFRQVTQVEKP